MNTTAAAHPGTPPCLPEILRGSGRSDLPGLVIVCEHASNAFPPAFGDLGLDAATRESHAAWDPGALGVARAMRGLLDADLLAATVSRLLYDCNRPPEAPSAMPERSEIFAIPGNQTLTPAARAARAEAIYQPFRAALQDLLDQRGAGVLVTIHSFTPVYFGERRSCEIGILSDADKRLAEAMLAAVPADFPFKVEADVPYSAADGVTHTLRTHAVPRGWPNVMVEIRNDLISTPLQQAAMAGHLAAILKPALTKMIEARNTRDGAF